MIEIIFEPRAWYSPTQGYFIQKWMSNTTGPYVIVNCSTGVITKSLPKDARLLGESPTQWAYDQACTALKEHRERADNYEGRILAVVEKLIKYFKITMETSRTSDFEPLIDALIHQNRDEAG